MRIRNIEQIWGSTIDRQLAEEEEEELGPCVSLFLTAPSLRLALMSRGNCSTDGRPFQIFRTMSVRWVFHVSPFSSLWDIWSPHVPQLVLLSGLRAQGFLRLFFRSIFFISLFMSLARHNQGWHTIMATVDLYLWKFDFKIPTKDVELVELHFRGNEALDLGCVSWKI